MVLGNLSTIVLNCGKSNFDFILETLPTPTGHKGHFKLHKLVGSMWAIIGFPQIKGLLVIRDKLRLQLNLIRLIICFRFLGIKGEIGLAGGLGGKRLFFK